MKKFRPSGNKFLEGLGQAKPKKPEPPKNNEFSWAKKPARVSSIFFRPREKSPNSTPSPSVLAQVKRGLKLVFWILSGAVVLVVVTAILLGGYVYLSKSDYFAVKHLNISDLGHLTMDEVLAAAGLDRPVNNLTFDATAAANSLGSLAWVEEAKISRVLPDGLLVEVLEYKPKAIVSLDQLYYIDEKGRAFKKLDPGENPDLPIISGFTFDELVSEGPMARQALAETFELMDILAQRNDEFRLDSVSELNYDNDLGLTVYTRRSGLKLRVGFGSYLEKFRRLGRVMAYLKLNGQAAGLSYIHLESPPRVVLRYNQEVLG
ncbi:MAG: FtsQ-type POTRA domain-containing protein [Deltaproteobacteria bacterium]|jgi:cell division protein FtsQ|nr:FtsQ-type POTRA domain-containing protein [Deltaproteobacteria bacterium]